MGNKENTGGNMKIMNVWIEFIIILSVILLLAGSFYSIGYNVGKRNGFKEGQDFIAFTSGENKQNIINEITKAQKELTDFANKQKEIYGKTYR